MRSIASALLVGTASIASALTYFPDRCSECLITNNTERVVVAGDIVFPSRCHAECEGYPVAAISAPSNVVCPAIACTTKKDICVNGVIQFRDECDLCQGPPSGTRVDGKCPNNCGCTEKGQSVCSNGKTFKNHCSARCAGNYPSAITPLNGTCLLQRDDFTAGAGHSGVALGLTWSALMMSFLV